MIVCECCGANAALCVSRWSCRACPTQHIVCLVCLGKVVTMQQDSDSHSTEFIACPKSLVMAYELAPVESQAVDAAKQWTTWWEA